MDYTSTELLSIIKLKGYIPSNATNGISDADILRFMNMEQRYFVVPTIMSIREEFFVKDYTTSIGTSSTFAIPPRAVGNKLRDVLRIDPNGNKFSIARIEPEDLPRFNLTSNVVRGFYVENNNIILLGNISTSDILGTKYFRRPNDVVVTTSASQVSAINTASVKIQNMVYTKVDSSQDVTMSYTDGATAGSEVVTVSGYNISVQIQSGVSTATQINTAIGNSVPAMVLITKTTSGTASTAQVVTNVTSVKLKSVELGTASAVVQTGTTLDFIQQTPFFKSVIDDATYGSINVCNGTIVIYNLVDPVTGLFPTTLTVGDWCCNAGETTIPQLPLEAIALLTERTVMKICQALGDKENYIIAKTEANECVEMLKQVLSDRVEGEDRKIVNVNNMAWRNRRFWS